ncbi:glycoside hydrolase family 3 C-terminal domain-containing protein [Flammeovirga yaeyamensis]|uniref:beta-glucosidase n=1 Tax=Flammeovirga yaeyamensis TaxID=367791 RepID=A0AAX1NAH2_9BACT|nr:glycoside hydrolase family 3 N-terminal domain-containing protein [Flammeovirga yaeyamensis]MBB3697857.1 beta-glucosidase [Flammeovirga yaeyamensis]NMF35788.1 beta-glucosidase [Flammeovirga yaeyamensis]QWG03260.1 glycoside hydrolase family 3 C-terminal domain-containing protein [Flammeovirga yaeyamensis]
MKKNWIRGVLAAALCSVTLGFNTPNVDPTQQENIEIIIKSNLSVEDKVEKILQQLTLEEKVGQMTQITLDVITKGENVFVSDEPLTVDKKLLEEAIKKYKIGSVLNTANNRARSTEKWNEVITQIQKVAMKEIGVPVLYGVDAIHGTTYTAGATFFPQQIGMAATWNPELNRQGCEVTAYETRASSIPWDFSPVLDMGRNPAWPRIWETYGEDVYLTSQMGIAAVKGYEGENNDLSDNTKVASCIKHFLGYGSERSGKDRTPSYLPEIELREHYLPSYKAAIDAGAHTIMINSGIINGTPVHASYKLLTDLLKKELGFEGLVVTDWADIENLHNRDKVAATHKEAVKQSINAGIDMSMVPYNFNFCGYLIELVNEGEVPMERIDDAVRRILTVKVKLGLFETPAPKVKDYPKFGSKEHEQIAYNAASESITLLKNDKDILPLKKGTKILVAGPNANSMRTLNGGWTYSWQGEKVEEFAQDYNTIFEAVQNTFGKENVNLVQGVEYNHEGQYYEEKNIDIQAAVKAASSADVVLLCLGENTYTETPGNLHDLYISQNQRKLAEALAATGKPVVLILNEGRPRLISQFESDMQAVVHTYLPGNFGGDALADILVGDVNPSGKLPYSYPMYPNALGTYDHKPSEASEKMEGMYDYNSSLPFQYAFGFGLSYTTFEYANLKVSNTDFGPDDNIKISVDVKNTGKVEGKEVVQLFTKDVYASITPDNKRLRRFEKVNLKPGETKTVSFTLSARDLAFVDADLKWTVEEGEFKLMIGDKTTSVNVTKTKKFDQASN